MMICNAEQARFIDRRATEKYHIPSLLLMEHAAIRLFHSIKEATQPLCIVCGPGNNGGDGMALARLLYQADIPFTLFLYAQTLSETQHIQLDILNALSIDIITDLDKGLDAIKHSQTIIDCLFGNGLSRDIEGDYYTIIDTINHCSATTISVDVPSGLDATTGTVRGIAVKADQTFALDCFKEGLFSKEGAETAGTLSCLDIGIPHEPDDGMIWIDQEVAKACLPSRSPFSHKGSHGKALLIGGSQSMPGALSMAARACYASGIGTLTVMLPACIDDLFSTKFDSAMRIVAPEENGTFATEAVELLERSLSDYELIAIGNGMGRTEVTKKMVAAVLQSSKAVLLDADAFWAIQDQTELLNRQAPTLLTPHIKELSYLLKEDPAGIADHPIEAARRFSSLFPQATLILKSSVTVISKANRQALLYAPNSALAKGGSGDILCGILAGCYGQRKDDFESAMIAVYLHSQCAQTKKDPAVAGPDDFIECLDQIMQTLREG